MARANLRLDKAYLTAIWLETLFYGEIAHSRSDPRVTNVKLLLFVVKGINLLLFFSYLFIARYKRKTPRVNKVILSTAIAMFCLSTTHVALGFSRLIEGFIYLRDQPGGPGAFFSDVSIPANVAKVIVHTINSILGDSILVSLENSLTSNTGSDESWRYGVVIMFGVKAGGSAFSLSS
jgi:hypothetical protein